ncbi:MAG: alpha/beta hydrolase [Dehalococcoidia bacterium]
MPTVKIGDINMYYEIHGDGEPLVLIMGYGASSRWGIRHISALSQEYSVVLFDNRGTGQSDKPDIPYTMEMMAGDVAGLLEAVGIDAAHVYGISMGGMIALELALRHPEKVISLILGSTIPGGPNTIMPDQEGVTILFDMERKERLTPEEQAREELPFLCSQQFIDTNPELMDELISNMLEFITPLHVYRRQGEAIREFNAYDRLHQIKAPTLIMAGTGDRLVPVDNAHILASRIPNNELVLFEGAQHVYSWEVEHDANKAVLDFLGQHRRSRLVSL